MRRRRWAAAEAAPMRGRFRCFPSPRLPPERRGARGAYWEGGQPP